MVTSFQTAASRPMLPSTAPRADIAHLQTLVLDSPQSLVLSAGDDRASVPAQVVEALRQALEAFARNQAVTILPTETLLTTQQAADLVGVSRPTLIKLLEAGEIPYVTPGRHRRIQLTDVLDYQRRSAAQTTSALDELMQDSADFYVTAPSSNDG